MASASFQFRSDSLPSKAHPLTSEIEEQIHRLRDSEGSCTSSTSIVHQLSGVQDLHDCVDKLLLLPLTQQLLAQQKNKKCVEDFLDGSLRLLDVCNTSKDALLQTKEYTLELQSTIRRRQGSIENEVRKFVTSRKMAKKAIQKALITNLRTSSPSDYNNEISKLVGILKEVQAITLAVLKSFMSFVSGSNYSQSKLNKWSLLSKIILQKRTAIACDCERDEEVNEFAMTDTALESLLGCKTTPSKYHNLQTHLKDLEFSILDLEHAIQALFRRMIKTRVSLLNIFN